MDTSARGRDSRGLVEGTYVRGGACVGLGRTCRGKWSVHRGLLEGTSEQPGVKRGLFLSRVSVQTCQAGLASGLGESWLFPPWLLDGVLRSRPQPHPHELCAPPAYLMRLSHAPYHRRLKPHTNSKNKVKLHPRPVGDEERSCWGGLVPHLGAGAQTGRPRPRGVAVLAWNPDQAARVDACAGWSSSAATRRVNLVVCRDAGHGLLVPRWPPPG